eukprot:3780685-Prorocentrum_lima.AAC.1
MSIPPVQISKELMFGCKIAALTALAQSKKRKARIESEENDTRTDPRDVLIPHTEIAGINR